jgi:hypothetical protein
MKRFHLATAGGLVAVLAWAGSAAAQNPMNSSGAYPTPAPFNAVPGSSYAVAPALPGSGGTYGYAQQNLGRGLGMSPNAYYSRNYFSTTPTAPSAYAPMAGAGGYAPSGMVTTTGTPGVSGAASATPTANSYATANATYYRVRRVGPIRRLLGLGRR